MKSEKNQDDNFVKVLTHKRWSSSRINDWYEKQPWYVGCNYIPSTAVNQLEMFQPDTYDPQTINQELDLAESLGFNALRVYLHNLLWENNAQELKETIYSFLKICDEHHIKVMFVFFDDCWNHNPSPGSQPNPIPGVHNSRWLASPGKERLKEESDYSKLENYMKDIMDEFKKDNRILAWDLYNEPGNFGVRGKSISLLIKSFMWAREINPDQPITVGLWQYPTNKKTWFRINRICIECSDIISFHHYEEVEETKIIIKKLMEYNRPLICTEYLARTTNNFFQTHLPIFKKYKIAAFNWGLVSGKTQTIYSWESKKGSPEPEIWYHDIFRTDGKPYSKEEINFIRDILKK